MPAVAVTSFALFAALVQVEGTTSCPSAALVAARLGELLPADAASAQPDRARLSEEADELVIVLKRADGLLLGTRRLPRTYGCEDLASATAVSLAAWESDVHPEFAPHLAARTRMPSVAPPVLVPVLAPPPRPARWTVNGGVAVEFGGSVDVPAVAGGAVVGAWLTPPRALLSLRAEIAGQSERQITLREGSASWRRWTLGLGLEGPFFADAEGRGGRLRWFALAHLAWLGLRGEGFAVNHGDNVFDPGVGTGVRMVLARGRWSSFVELAASFWPVRHDVLVGGSGDTGRLPAVEAFVRIGAALGAAQ